MNHVQKMIPLLDELGVDALLITSPANRFYATGFESSAGIALVAREESVFFTDFRYIEAAESIEHFRKEMVGRERNYAALMNQFIEAHTIKKLGFEDKAMSCAEQADYAAKLEVEFVPMGSALFKLRSAKESWEIERMRKAQRIAEHALDEILGWIQPGQTEKQIAAELVYRMMRAGAEKMSFDPIVVSGPNSSKPHGVPGDRKIEAGDFLTMDFGCIYEGYCSDMTRTVAIGHATGKMRAVYEIVLEAQLAGLAAFRAEIPGQAVDAAARAVIEQAGYGAFFGHGFGHSLGIEIHEPPNCGATETAVLPLGAVVSAEPGIYLPGEFGVRIEDVVVVREHGCENLTNAKKDLIIL